MMDKNWIPSLGRIQKARTWIRPLWQKIGRVGPQSVKTYTRLGLGRNIVPLLLIGLGMSLAIAACTPSATKETTNAPKADIELNLVSFSVTKAAYERIVPKFVEKWQKEHQQTLDIKQSYGASGTQALLVVEGREEADVVHLSLAPDVSKIEEAGLIGSGWQKEFPQESIVTKSVVAIVTREGNPKNIKSWDDLTQTGLTVVTPNPYTSGGGRWNFLALWNAQKQAGADEPQIVDFLSQVYKRSPQLPGSARKATLDFFQEKQGDVLLTYENEVILKAIKGEKLPYAIPDVNFSIDNPIAIVDQNVEQHKTREVAQAFVQYLYSPEAQEEFSKIGYRVVDPNIASSYPQVKSLATVEDYGGWPKIRQQFFDSGALVSKVFELVHSPA
jgi:sulfate transport system substrate-binding protein